MTGGAVWRQSSRTVTINFPFPVASSLAGQAEEADQPECRPQPFGQRAQRVGGLRQPQRPLAAGQPPQQTALRARRRHRAARAGRGRKQVARPQSPTHPPSFRGCHSLTIFPPVQVTEPALFLDKPQPQGHVAGGEPVAADAEVPDGGRRAHRGESADVLPAAPAALAEPG